MKIDFSFGFLRSEKSKKFAFPREAFRWTLGAQMIYKTFWPQFAPDTRLYLHSREWEREREQNTELKLCQNHKERYKKFHSHQPRTKHKKAEPVPIIIHKKNGEKDHNIKNYHNIFKIKISTRKTENLRSKPNGTRAKSKKKIIQTSQYTLQGGLIR